MDLTGKGGELRVSISDNATLDASNWRASSVEASATGDAKGRVYAKDNASVKTSGNADLRVEGNADVEKND